MDILPLIAALAPAEQPLLDFCWSRLTDEQMYTIATRPWIGDADAYMAAMRAFRDNGLPEDDSDWHIYPSEAFAITRWTHLTDGIPHKSYANSYTLREWHGMRLTACVTLAYADVLEYSQFDIASGDTAVFIAESALFLGPEATALATAFLAWVVLKMDWEYVHNDHIRRVLALFFVAVRTEGVSETTLHALVDCLVGEDVPRSETPETSDLRLSRLEDHDQPSNVSAMAIIAALVVAPDLNASLKSAACRLHAVMTTQLEPRQAT